MALATQAARSPRSNYRCRRLRRSLTDEFNVGYAARCRIDRPRVHSLQHAVIKVGWTADQPPPMSVPLRVRTGHGKRQRGLKREYASCGAVRSDKRTLRHATARIARPGTADECVIDICGPDAAAMWQAMSARTSPLTCFTPTPVHDAERQNLLRVHGAHRAGHSASARRLAAQRHNTRNCAVPARAGRAPGCARARSG